MVLKNYKLIKDLVWVQEVQQWVQLHPQILRKAYFAPTDFVEIWFCTLNLCTIVPFIFSFFSVYENYEHYCHSKKFTYFIWVLKFAMHHFAHKRKIELIRLLEYVNIGLLYLHLWIISYISILIMILNFWIRYFFLSRLKSCYLYVSKIQLKSE